MRVVAGALAAIVGLIVAAAGTVVGFVLVGPDGARVNETELSTDGAVIATTPEAITFSGELRVTVEAADSPVFIGLAHHKHVRNFLADATYLRVTELDTAGSLTAEEVSGKQTTLASATDRGWWEESVSGDGPQTLRLQVPDGPYDLVVMHADGSEGLSVDASFGVGYPGVFRAALIAIGLGAALLIGGILLLVLGRRRGEDLEEVPVWEGQANWSGGFWGVEGSEARPVRQPAAPGQPTPGQPAAPDRGGQLGAPARAEDRSFGAPVPPMTDPPHPAAPRTPPAVNQPPFGPPASDRPAAFGQPGAPGRPGPSGQPGAFGQPGVPEQPAGFPAQGGDQPGADQPGSGQPGWPPTPPGQWPVPQAEPGVWDHPDRIAPPPSSPGSHDSGAGDQATDRYAFGAHDVFEPTDTPPPGKPADQPFGSVDDTTAGWPPPGPSDHATRPWPPESVSDRPPGGGEALGPAHRDEYRPVDTPPPTQPRPTQPPPPQPPGPYGQEPPNAGSPEAPGPFAWPPPPTPPTPPAQSPAEAASSVPDPGRDGSPTPGSEWHAPYDEPPMVGRPEDPPSPGPPSNPLGDRTGPDGSFDPPRHAGPPPEVTDDRQPDDRWPGEWHPGDSKPDDRQPGDSQPRECGRSGPDGQDASTPPPDSPGHSDTTVYTFAPPSTPPPGGSESPMMRSEDLLPPSESRSQDPAALSPPPEFLDYAEFDETGGPPTAETELSDNELAGHFDERPPWLPPVQGPGTSGGGRG